MLNTLKCSFSLPGSLPLYSEMSVKKDVNLEAPYMKKYSITYPFFNISSSRAPYLSLAFCEQEGLPRVFNKTRFKSKKETHRKCYGALVDSTLWKNSPALSMFPVRAVPIR